MTGLKCDVCKDGYFQVGSSPLEGCSACDCNSAGTLANSTICDKVVGNCTCKQNVEGRTCSECVSNTWNLTEANPQGKVIKMPKIKGLKILTHFVFSHTLKINWQ